MNLSRPNRATRLLPLALICLQAFAQPVIRPVITLEPPDSHTQPVVEKGHTLPEAPENFHRFGAATVGEAADLEKLTLRFAAEDRLLAIHSTADFRVEQGSSCVEGNVYSAGSACTLLVRFTPQGPGHRLGKITLKHSGSTTPMSIGLGGTGTSPSVSFTPSVITTVPATLSGSNGVLKSALNLAIDGGDTLYIADTGNNLIRSMDASGVLTTANSATISAPAGIGVDAFGEIFFTEPAANLLWEIFDYGSTFAISASSGTSTCTYAAPCKISSQQLSEPGQITTDPYGQMFFAEGSSGAAYFNPQPFPGNFARLYNPFTYQESTTADAFSVDANDTLYTYWNTSSGPCQIVSQSFNSAANYIENYLKVAGGRTCGFAGDGGQARGAEIGKAVGQMAFDIAGNLYFTDTANQRVRRIDASTGIIRTIAGNGSVGNTGDGGAADAATLHNPGGLAVDSQGQVYVLNYSASSGTAQVVRQVGTTGAAIFNSQPAGTTSAVKLVNLANTGNSPLVVQKATITGANASDFTVDANTTSCNFTAGNTLSAGQSCQVGILFKPGGSGSRTANLVLLDNTVNNSNTILLKGSSSLPSPAFKITAPTAGSTTTSGTTVKFSVSVTSSTSPAPSGTVTFKVDGATFGSPVSVSSGAASINLTGLTVKTHAISATYSGDTHYATATASESIIVKAASTVAPHPKIAPIPQRQ